MSNHLFKSQFKPILQRFFTWHCDMDAQLDNLPLPITPSNYFDGGKAEVSPKDPIKKQHDCMMQPHLAES